MSEITSFFNLNEPDVRRMMEAADVNNDGQIDYTEFITAAFDKQKLLQREKIQQAFNLFDTDEDGGISTEELRNAFQNSVTAEKGVSFWEEVMEQVDKNKDGFISFEEFQAHMFEVVDKRATFYAPN